MRVVISIPPVFHTWTCFSGMGFVKAFTIEEDDNMVWLILGAYEGREGILAV
jgi:hypothetical protein